MYWKRVFPTFIILFALVFSRCVRNPVQPENRLSREYLFAWQFLDVFFIFRERLPSDPFSFDNPGALYASVNEPYTIYYNPERAGEILKGLSTQSAGIGVTLDSTESGYVIRGVFPESPASKAGLQKNDTLVAINGTQVSGLPFDTVGALLQGEVGEEKVLTIKRGDEINEISVAIEEFLAPSVFYDSLDTNIAYIMITSFFSQTGGGGTAQEFDSALKNTEWAEATILDLRNNPGGEIQQAILVTSEFFQPGTPLAQATERIFVESENRGITRDTIWRAVPIESNAIGRNFYILMNGRTASASEILISSLNANRNDIVTIGQTTFGKARGQVISLTPDSGLARVTYALLEPIGAPSYGGVGITPEIQISAEQNALQVTVDRIEQTLVRRRVTGTITANVRRVQMIQEMYKRSDDEQLCIKWLEN